MYITATTEGSLKNTQDLLARLKRGEFFKSLDRYGKEGVAALKAATPIDEGLTAESWRYDIIKRRGGYTLVWSNTNSNDGVNVAVLIQYGHGTGSGGYVQGIDYINPVIQPLFKKIANEVWKEVSNG